MKKRQKNSKFGKTADEVCTTLITEVCKLIEAVKRNDIQQVNSSLLYEVFKAKLTYLYEPDKWIPICTKPDIEILLKYFEINYSPKEKLTYERKKLFDFYKQVKEKIPFITTWEFMHVLYFHPFYRNILRGEEKTEFRSNNNNFEGPESNEEDEEINVDDLDLSDFEGTYSDASFQNNNVSTNLFKKNKTSKLNYQKKQKNNERIGKIGEKLIYNDEISKLYNLRINKKVDYVASEDDSKGFDIASYDEKGEKILIEVKTTKSNKQDLFYLTDTEKLKLIEFGQRYRIYRVYNLDLKKKTYNVVIFDGLVVLKRFDFEFCTTIYAELISADLK